MTDRWFKPAAIILGILIVLGLFGNIYLLTKKQKLLNAPVSPVVPTTSIITTPTIDPTVGWKTYTNNKFRFEMKYPPISEPEEYQSKEIYYMPIVSIELSMSKKLPSPEQIPPEKISLNAIQNIDIYENMTIDQIAQREVSDSGFKYTISKKSINNYEAAQVELSTDNGSLEYFIKSPNKNLIIVAISTPKSKEEMDQILSTFKFLD